MIRIQTYNSDPRRVQAGGIRPGADLPAVRDVTGTAGGRTLDALLKAGGQLTDLAIREYVKDETARVSESLQMMNAELAAERDRYMRENQGRNALDAGEHFGKFAADRARELQREGGFEGRFAEQFRQQAMGNVLHFAEQGQAYARQQRAAWDQSVQEGARADFLNQVAQNFDNRDWIEFNLQKFAEDTEAMRPGLDNRAYLDGVRKEAAEIIVGGFLGANRIGDARGAFAQYRDLLGDRANAVKVRIDARADALQARAEAARKRAEAERLRLATASGVRSILENVDEYPTLEEQREAAFRMADSVEDDQLREKLRTEISQEFVWREKRADATTAREVRQFQELARNQDWTPRQASDVLAQATGISDAAREKLGRDYDGRAEKATPENKAALAELRRLIDLGAENGGLDPQDADAVDAWIYRHGLTYEQGVKAHRYAEQGGIAGEVTQTQINRIYRTLFPQKKASSAPEDLFELVGLELKRTSPGKSATDEEVRRVMSRLFTEGQTENAGWFTWGVGKDENYMKALREGREQDWSADVEVPAEEEAGIRKILREAGVTPTPGRIRRYYWEMQGGKA